MVGFEEGDFLHPDGVEESEESLCSNYSDNYIYSTSVHLYTPLPLRTVFHAT